MTPTDRRAMRRDASWMADKLAASGAKALVAEYAGSKDPDLALIHGALKLAMPVLAEDPRQLAGQLRGRMLGINRPAIQELLAAIHPPGSGLWLRPLAPTLAPPNLVLEQTMRGHKDMVSTVAVT